jgi:dipeptidyl-peptidase-4
MYSTVGTIKDFRMPWLLPGLLLALICFSGCSSSSATQDPTEKVTPRMLVSPNALVGPGPSGFSWSPVGARLVYVDPVNGIDVLWLYDAVAGTKRVLLDPSSKTDNIDLSSVLWSPQGDVLLFSGDTSLWLLDIVTGNLKSLAGGGSKTGLMFLPTGTHISYVQNNDIYTVRISDSYIQRLTTDGSQDIFNGGLDWVYNEELATRAAQPAYAWSPDGKWLVYLRLDDSGVENHPVTDYDTVPPTLSYTRYPTAGSQNPKASVHVISMEAGLPGRTIPLPEDTEYVLPFFTWTPDGQEAVYITVNRDHTVMRLMAWSPAAGTGRTILVETDNNWINEDRYAAPIFLGDGREFLWLSESDGFMHLYLYSRQGSLVRQLTAGDWMIDSNTWNLITPGKPVHIDPSATRAYFITTKDGPLDRRLYGLDIATGRLDLVSQQPGFHSFSLSGDGRYLVDQFSDVATPPVTMIVKADRTASQLLARCAGPSLTLPRITREFLTIKAHDGTDLYAQLVKPENFDPARKYPVVIHWYGGPGLQMVSNRYGTTNIFNIIERDVLYAQQGFLVWRLDNRGSFGRGHAFETPIMGHLGPAALDDHLAGVEHLRSLPFVDAARIGADGKSFGGFLTLYALINAPEVFRCGVDVAGPTNWAYYDTIYTERYMRTPSRNPAGYAATNLIAAASRIAAQPLLIHGLNDTNVHLQNTVNFVEALEAADKPFNFVPLPNTSHSITGDSLVATLSSSVEYFTFCLSPR